MREREESERRAQELPVGTLGDGVLRGNDAGDVARREDEVPVVPPTCARVFLVRATQHNCSLENVPHRAVP